MKAAMHLLPTKQNIIYNIVLDDVTNLAGKTMKMILTNCGKVDAKCVDLERHTEIKTKLQAN